MLQKNLHFLHHKATFAYYLHTLLWLAAQRKRKLSTDIFVTSSRCTNFKLNPHHTCLWKEIHTHIAHLWCERNLRCQTLSHAPLRNTTLNRVAISFLSLTSSIKQVLSKFARVKLRVKCVLSPDISRHASLRSQINTLSPSLLYGPPCFSARDNPDNALAAETRGTSANFSLAVDVHFLIKAVKPEMRRQTHKSS